MALQCVFVRACVDLFEDGTLVRVQEDPYSSAKWRVQYAIKIQDKCKCMCVFVCVCS